MNPSPWRLTEPEWQACRHLFNAKRYTTLGRPRAVETRSLVEAVLFHQFNNLAARSHSAGWNELPSRFGVSPSTANRRYREWVSDGRWVRFWDLLAARRAQLPLNTSERGALAVASPVSRIVCELDRAHRFFNDRFFWRTLPMTVLTVTCANEDDPIRTLGFFSRNAWPLRSTNVDHIAVTTLALRRGAVEVMATLVHEMVHQWNAHHGVTDFGRKQYHNAQFRDSARLVGLECEYTSRGYSSTRPTQRLRSAIADFRPDRDAFSVGRCTRVADVGPLVL
jgi:hypothetical protein